MHGTPLCRGSVNFQSRFRLRYWQLPLRLDCPRQKKAPTGRTSRGGQLRKSDHKASGISSPFHRILRTTARLDIVSLPKPRWVSMAATAMVKASSFLVGDDDGDQEITPVAVAAPVLPKANEGTWRRRRWSRAPSFFVGDDDGDQEIAPVAVAAPVLPKAHEMKEHGGDGDGRERHHFSWVTMTGMSKSPQLPSPP